MLHLAMLSLLLVLTPRASSGISECCQRGKQTALQFSNSALEHAEQGGTNICIPPEGGGASESEEWEQSCRSMFYRCCRSQQRSMACQWGREASLLPENSKKTCFQLFKGFELANVMKDCCICCKMGLSGKHLYVDTGDVMCHESSLKCSTVSKGTGTETTTLPVTTPFTMLVTSTSDDRDVSEVDEMEEETTPPTPVNDTDLSGFVENENTTARDFQTNVTSGSSYFFNETERMLLEIDTEPNNTTETSTSSMSSVDLEPTTQKIECPDDSYEWNSQRLICERILTSCPKGYVMDRVRRICRLPEGPVKSCQPGYQLNADSWQCEDVNECSMSPSPCRQSQKVCHNTPGSYRCMCEKGYQMTLDGCEDIDECTTLQPTPCPLGKECFNTRGSFECRRVMPCGFGYSLDLETQECVDIDECKSDTNVCGPGMQCVNVRGGHKCEEVQCPVGLWRNPGGKCSLCKEGYNYNNVTHLCEDINECEVPTLARRCRAFENCVNRPGTYDCILKLICKKGTRLSPNGTQCDDIDECQERHFECAEDEICVNEYSSYRCKSSPCLPSQIYDYSYKQCTCKSGFRLNEYEGCQDINECEQNPCGEDRQCINLIGSYSCYTKNACPAGMYRPNTLSTCVDLDECTNGEARCPSNMGCVNTIGSYTCICRRGYKKERDQCVDIDDCQVYQKEVTCPDPTATCINTIGSYVCSCPHGFAWQDHPERKCDDVDECQRDPRICGIGHKCINLVGSYRCHCARGYAIASDGKSCKDVDECSLRPRGRPTCPNGRCFNFPGGYQCQCPPGYRLGSGNRCEDIDECRESLSACALNVHTRNQKDCINLKGTHKCVVNTCPPGYAKSYLGNGMKCKLDASWHCEVGNVQCHRERPYHLTYHFIELSTDVSTPHTIVRVDHSHLPSGNKRMSLLPKYAINTVNNKYINTDWLFQIDPSQTEGSVDIRLIGALDSPSELLLELNLEVYHAHLFIGKSTAMIYIYVTKYPDDYAKDDL